MREERLERCFPDQALTGALGDPPVLPGGAAIYLRLGAALNPTAFPELKRARAPRE